MADGAGAVASLLRAAVPAPTRPCLGGPLGAPGMHLAPPGNVIRPPLGFGLPRLPVPGLPPGGGLPAGGGLRPLLLQRPVLGGQGGSMPGPPGGPLVGTTLALRPPGLAVDPGLPEMPPDVADQLRQLKEDREKLTAAAEEAREEGDDEAVEFKEMLRDDIDKKITELEGKYAPPGSKPPPAPAPAPSPLPLVPPAGAFPGMPGMPVMPGLRPPATIMPPGMPGMPGMPVMPGMPPPPDANQAAVNLTQLQAMQYEQQKRTSMRMEPEVIELAAHFNITDRHARLLDEQLKQRNNTFDDDIAAMYEILHGAKNPADLLMVSIRWMAEGVFRGTLTPSVDVEKAAKKYKLDAPSACKLAEVLEQRQDPDDCLLKISSHLERSNKPSSLVMMMLKDIKTGKEVEWCTKTPAIGSYAHKEENKKNARGRSRSRRGGGGDRQRARSRSARRPRERSRSKRPRSRSRDRDRDRGGGDRGGGRRSISRSYSRRRGKSRSRSRGG